MNRRSDHDRPRTHGEGIGHEGHPLWRLGRRIAIALTLGLSGRLLRVLAARRQQRDVAGSPPLVNQDVYLVVGALECLVSRALDETDHGTFGRRQAHAHGCQ